MEKTLIITFHDTDLLLGTTIHNSSLYVSTYFGKFMVARILVNCGALFNIMSLNTLIYFEFVVLRLDTYGMLLKGFIESSERALGSITHAFEIDGWTFEIEFHIININNSFNSLLRRP